MRTRDDIVMMKTIIAAYETQTPTQSQAQRATMYGVRTMLSMAHFIWPMPECWQGVIHSICKNVSRTQQVAWDNTMIRRPPKQIPNVGEVALFRQTCVWCQNVWSANPPADLDPEWTNVLVGLRSACAWMLELPAGGKFLDDLWWGHQLSQAIPQVQTAEFLKRSMQ